MTDGTGAAIAVNKYDEFGKPHANNQGRFQYTGQMWLPEVGLYHYKNRTYSPGLGRFLQADPIGTLGGMNLYAHVGNDPVNFTDPWGLLVDTKKKQPNDKPPVETITVVGTRGPGFGAFGQFGTPWGGGFSGSGNGGETVENTGVSDDTETEDVIEVIGHRNNIMFPVRSILIGYTSTGNVMTDRMFGLGRYNDHGRPGGARQDYVQVDRCVVAIAGAAVAVYLATEAATSIAKKAGKEGTALGTLIIGVTGLVAFYAVYDNCMK